MKQPSSGPGTPGQNCDCDDHGHGQNEDEDGHLWYAKTHIRQLFTALGSDEAGRVSLPSDRARDTTCHQGFFFLIFYILSKFSSL